MAITICNRTVLRGFLTQQLEEDDRLEFLFHLDSCTACWDAVYNATKSQHPHFYKRPSRKTIALDKEIKSLEFQVEEPEEVFEVA